MPNLYKFCGNIWKFWNGPPYRNKSGSFHLLDVAVYRQSSKAKACTKKLSQILANNIVMGEGDWPQNLCEILLLAVELEPGTFGFRLQIDKH